MRFRPLGTDDVDAGETLRLSEANEGEGDPNSYTDAELETPLGSDLYKKLLKVAREAQTAEEEQGVNVLYLALGFLTWFEDNASSLPREAPLLLCRSSSCETDARPHTTCASAMTIWS